MASPYGMPPMYPPWMMAPVNQQQNQNQKDPTEIATSLINTLYDMVERSRPQTDETLKDAFRDIREEFKRLQDRIESVTSRERHSDLEPLLQKIDSLEKKLSDTTRKPNALGTIKELKSLVTELEEAGLAVRPGKAEETVDDKLKLEKFKFEREKAEKETELERKRIEAEAARSEMAKGLLSALLKRSLRKAAGDRDDSSSLSVPGPVARSPQSSPRKEVVVEEYHTDGGVVKETRPVSKKGD